MLSPRCSSDACTGHPGLTGGLSGGLVLTWFLLAWWLSDTMHIPYVLACIWMLAIFLSLTSVIVCPLLLAYNLRNHRAHLAFEPANQESADHRHGTVCWLAWFAILSYPTTWIPIARHMYLTNPSFATDSWSVATVAFGYGGFAMLWGSVIELLFVRLVLSLCKVAFR